MDHIIPLVHGGAHDPSNIWRFAMIPINELAARLAEENRVLKSQVSGLREQLESAEAQTRMLLNRISDLQKHKRLYGALAQVRQFHGQFNVPVTIRPIMPASPRVDLRIDLITEESTELLNALGYRDMILIADGLADLIYVCLGTALEFGIPLGEVFDEVHASNMRKVGSKNREDGKITKPEGWTPPDIERILRWAGMQ